MLALTPRVIAVNISTTNGLRYSLNRYIIAVAAAVVDRSQLFLTPRVLSTLDTQLSTLSFFSGPLITYLTLSDGGRFPLTFSTIPLLIPPILSVAFWER